MKFDDETVKEIEKIIENYLNKDKYNKRIAMGGPKAPQPPSNPPLRPQLKLVDESYFPSKR